MPKTVKEAAPKDMWSEELARRLNKNTPAGLPLPTNLTAQAFLIAHLPPQLLAGGVMWCLPSHQEATAADELLHFWLSALNRPTSPAVIPFPDGFIQWLTASRQAKAAILLVATAHLGLALPAPKLISQNSLELKLGTTVKPIAALHKLTAAGYEPGPLPDDTGWFQRRGSTIIISAANGSWRLNWHGNRLETIEEFSLESGLAGKSLSQVNILPQRLPPSASDSLANFITADQIILGAPADFLPKHSRRLEIDATSSRQLFAPAPLFVKQWTELAQWLKEKIISQEKTIVLTATPYRWLSSLPPNTPLPEVYEVPAAIAPVLTGFVDKTAATYYLTDRELYGPTRRAPRRHLAAYERLRPGDYLVHIDHGIGRFGGLTERLSEGNRREYFLVAYASDDKLYVPIEHTDRLSRYLGSPHPALERLSSAHWFQVQKKIKKETAALAQELLALYAKRHLTSIKPWRSFPEEEVLTASFPYPLTSDQLKTWAEISADLTGRQPMDRLVCGDVGFGKTELAVRAAARASLNGYQTAVLVPTTILAQQHFDTFSTRLSAFGIKLGLASRAQSASEVKHTLKALAQGKTDIIIGTHRLLARDVAFHRLGLLIIDEEQRFGVKQKEQLRALKPSIHVLALSATPIPRTLNLAVASLRELSIILSPPAGRQAVKMHFGAPDDNLIKKAIQTELGRQGQIFYLVQYVKNLPAAELRLKRLLPELKIGVVHGQKPPREVASIMHRFDTKEIDLLLATSIIENGLDLPNVNTLIVESAQNFGLADLYQLKGRVGRGLVKAQAYFLTTGKRSLATEKRLEALAQTEELGEGLSLALKDLELRGTGAILGREQHGQVATVGLHLYGQMLADAIEEQRSGQPLRLIHEVRLNLPLDGWISPALVPAEEQRIHLYQRLASIPEPTELASSAQALIGRPLNDTPADRLLKNLLTLLEIKLLAEQARLQEVTCHQQGQIGRFYLRFLIAPNPDAIERLTNFDDNWHKVETSWQAMHPLAADAWIPWLKTCLKLLEN